jgi:hypothetical protein
MDHLGPTTEVKITNSRFWASGPGAKPVFGGSPRRDFAVGTEITYDAGPPSKVTVAFPRENPDNTAWSWLATNMSDSGIGRVSYLEGSTPRWGSIITIKSPSGPDGAVEVEIEWEPGAGGGITNGTALRFYKLINLVLQNVTFDGWPNEESVDGTAHQAANHEIYTLAGHGVPTSVWGIVITP